MWQLTHFHCSGHSCYDATNYVQLLKKVWKAGRTGVKRVVAMETMPSHLVTQVFRQVAARFNSSRESFGLNGTKVVTSGLLTCDFCFYGYLRTVYTVLCHVMSPLHQAGPAAERS